MEEKRHRDFGPIFWVHIFYIVLIYTSPFWLDWKWMLPIAVSIGIQWTILGGCFLTRWEFGKTEHNSFIWYYLDRLGFKVDLKKVKSCTDYWTAIYLVISTVIWQIILGHAALF